jgi:MFS transporter, DHA1 family, multidrug resistance protein
LLQPQSSPQIPKEPNPILAFLMRSAGLTGGLFLLFLVITASNNFHNLWSYFVSTEGNLQAETLSRWSILIVLVSIVAMPFSGFISDRYGRIKLVLAGVFLMGASLLAAGLSTGLMRVPVTPIFAALGLALILPPLLSQMIDFISSPWLLATLAALYLVAMRLASFTGLFAFVGLQRVGMERELIVAGIVLLLLGGLAVAWIALVNNLLVSYFSVSVELLHIKEDTDYIRLGLVLLSYLFITCATSSVYTSISVFLNRLGFTTTQNAMILSFGNMVGILMLPVILLAGVLADLIGWYSQRKIGHDVGRPAFLIVGVLLFLIGLVGMVVMRSSGGLIASQSLITLGSGLIFVVLLALAFRRISSHRWGLAAGLWIGAESLGLAIGSITTGLVGDLLGEQLIIVLGLVFTGLSVLALLFTVVWGRLWKGNPPVAVIPHQIG